MKHVKCKIDHLNTVFTIQSIDRLIDSFFALSTIPPFALQTSFHVVSIPFYISCVYFLFIAILKIGLNFILILMRLNLNLAVSSFLFRHVFENTLFCVLQSTQKNTQLKSFCSSKKNDQQPPLNLNASHSIVNN